MKLMLCIRDTSSKYGFLIRKGTVVIFSKEYVGTFIGTPVYGHAVELILRHRYFVEMSPRLQQLYQLIQEVK